MNSYQKCQEFLNYFQFYQKDPLKLAEFRRYIKADFEINAPIDENHTSALMYSMISGYSEYAKICVEEGSDVNIQDSNGNSPLLLIAQQSYSSYSLMEFFLKYAANPNLYNEKGYTALHYAAINNRSDLIRLLIKFKADVNLVDNENNNALLLLAGEVEYDTTTRQDSLNALLEAKVNINQQNNDGNNALMLFLDHPTKESTEQITYYVKNFVQYGIDLSQINKKTQNAFYFATLTNIAQIISLTYHKSINFDKLDWDWGFSDNIIELLHDLELKQQLDINLMNQEVLKKITKI